MPVRVVLLEGLRELPPEWREAEVLLSWSGARNVLRQLETLYACLPAPPPPLARDLLDIAGAVHMADVAVPRGRNEQWVRELELLLPVREPDFWTARADRLTHLLYVLTRDGFHLSFVPREVAATEPACASTAFEADTVSLFSGGVDSLAGAAMLLHTSRRPLLLCHYSGNPSIRKAQDQLAARLQALFPKQSALAGVGLQPSGRNGGAPPFPPAAAREPSQRSRSLLYMSLALAAGSACGLPEAYICENGILTVALPLSAARVGGLSTRSTHPRVLSLMNDLAAEAGLSARLTNPFVYQTKAEIIEQVLRPVLPPFDIQRSVSCWATGRASRQCGGCVACLIRRLSMLAAGLPDEAYELDVLTDPQRYLGTDAYTNLLDLLSQASHFQQHSDLELLQSTPELLDLAQTEVGWTEVLAMYRRFATEVQQVVSERFPEAARLL